MDNINNIHNIHKINNINNINKEFYDKEIYDIEYNIDEIENKEIIQYIDIQSYNMNLIPSNVSISTMGLTCYLGTSFNVSNIYKYMILEYDNVVAIKTNQGMRCLESLKHVFNSTNKNSGKNFFNQNTIIIRAKDNKFLNVKLFKNGSIQMTGCKDLNDANIVINKLINKLKEVLMIRKEAIKEAIKESIINNDPETTITFTPPQILLEIKFVENINDLNVSKFKINLINTNFGINYFINKEELFNILTSKNIFCRITTNHACVNIKYKIVTNNIESLVSIFVFQTGNIIITGAKKAEDIRSAYNFIVQFLNQNKSKIIKKDISSVLTIEDLKEVLQS